MRRTMAATNMIHNSSNLVIVALACCISAVSVVANIFWNSAKSESAREKADKEVVEKKKITNNNVIETGNNVEEEACNVSKPMFEYNDYVLAGKIVKMAERRATMWVPYGVSGAHGMEGQIGGRSHKPMLIFDSFVLKPVSLDHRGVREIAFYEALKAASLQAGFQTYSSLFGPRVRNRKRFDGLPHYDEAKVETETKLLHRLEKFTAKYFGTIEHNQSCPFEDEKATAGTAPDYFRTKPNSYILLHNATDNFSKPCVLDIKMGTKTFEPDASEEKKSYELKKYALQDHFGFRLTAMRIYDPFNEMANDLGYVYYAKEFGRSLCSKESVKEALLTFLGGAKLSMNAHANRSAAIQTILSGLKMMKEWFRDNESFAFYGSSILIIYEGDILQKEKRGENSNIASAKMIDFGRVRRQAGGDFGYYKGLSRLISILEEIHRESVLVCPKLLKNK